MTLSAGTTEGTQHWTAADYMALDDDERRELLEGELVMAPSPNIFHQQSITSLGARIQIHVAEHGLGTVFNAPFDVTLSEYTVVQPDLTFVRKGRLAELYDGHTITGAPDLVIEVLSPATARRDRHQKHHLYAEAGVSWLVYVEPVARFVEVCRLNDQGRYVIVTTAAENDILRLELFPELEIDLSKIWFEAPGSSETSETPETPEQT